MLMARGEMLHQHRRIEDYDNILVDFAQPDPIRVQLREEGAGLLA
jgi:hypothetical protein